MKTEIDQETVKGNYKPEKDSTCIFKKEKTLDEKLKKIDKVFRMFQKYTGMAQPGDSPQSL